MAPATVKLQLSFPPALDRALRVHLAEQGRGRKGDLSEFFAELVRARLSDWVRERALAAGHAEALAPDQVARAVEQLAARARSAQAASPAPGSAEPAHSAAAPGPAPAQPPRVVYSDDELEALSGCVLSWAAP